MKGNRRFISLPALFSIAGIDGPLGHRLAQQAAHARHHPPRARSLRAHSRGYGASAELRALEEHLEGGVLGPEGAAAAVCEDFVPGRSSRCVVEVAAPPEGAFESFFCGYVWSGFVGYALRGRTPACPAGFAAHRSSSTSSSSSFCVRYIFPPDYPDMTSHLRDLYPICRHAPDGKMHLGYGYAPPMPAEALPLTVYGVDGAQRQIRVGRGCVPGFNAQVPLCTEYTEALAAGAGASLSEVISRAAVNNTIHYLVAGHRYEEQALAAWRHHAAGLGMANFLIVATDVPLYVFLRSRGVDAVLYFPPPRPVEWCMTGAFLPQWRHVNFVKLGFALEVAKLGYDLVMLDGDARFISPPEWHPERYDVAYSSHQPPLSLECLFLRGSPATVALLRDAYDRTLDFAWDQEVLGYLILKGGTHAAGLRTARLRPPNQRLALRPGGPDESPHSPSHAPTAHPGAPRQYLQIAFGEQRVPDFPAVRARLAYGLCEAAARNRTLLLDAGIAAAVDAGGLARWFPAALQSAVPASTGGDVLEVAVDGAQLAAPHPAAGTSTCRHVHGLMFLVSPPRPARPLEHACFRTMAGRPPGTCARACAGRGVCRPGDAILRRCPGSWWRLPSLLRGWE